MYPRKMIFVRLSGLVFLICVSVLPKIEGKYADDDGTIVQLEKGQIRGHILQSENGNDYYAFQEIPYAAPPVGENRFQLPKEPEAWSGVLDTTKNTKVCYQTIVKYDNLKSDEDCLYINVYTPEKPGTDNLLPVLLWIHGGGLVNESSTYEYYGPKYIMDQGVVVVTFNYRLGPFGFVGTQDGVVPLNLGLKDQRFAIEWVNRNIHLFGGNPDQVTLVGESAGSLSVGLHLIGPWIDDKQLFHAVIMQSGTPISGICSIYGQDATQIAFNLGRAVDPSFTSSDSKELLKVLQNATAYDILWAGIPGGAALEDEGPFSYLGYQSFLDGNYKKVPVIIGFNSEEWLYLALYKDEALLESIDADPSQLIDGLDRMSDENRAIAGQLFKELYTDNTSFVENFGGYIRSVSDKLFTTSTMKQIELASREVPYYFYVFSYKGEIGGWTSLLPISPPGTGTVAHAEDLHYMWDDGSNSDLSKFPPEDGLMLHRYVKLWTNFVKFFNPTPEEDPLLSNYIWERTNPETIQYMNFNLTLETLEHPRQYQQVKPILETYIEEPSIAFT